MNATNTTKTDSAGLTNDIEAPPPEGRGDGSGPFMRP